MMLKIKKDNLIYLLGCIIWFIVSFFVPKSSYNGVLLFATVVIVFILVSWRRTEKIFNFYTIFICCCAVFYFGQYFVYFITGEEIVRWMSITSSFSKLSMNHTAIFILQCMLILHMGVLLFSHGGSNKKRCKTQQRILSQDLYVHKVAATAFFVITYIPAMIVGVVKVISTSVLNYSDLLGYRVQIFGGGLDEIISLLASFSLVAFIYTIIAFMDSPKIKIFIPFILIYIGVYYLSGSRLRVTLFIVIAFVIYNDLYKKITKRQILKLIPIFLIVLITVSGIGAVRGSFSAYGSVGGILEAVVDNFKNNNIIISLLNEFGMTSVVVTNVLEHCPTDVNHIWGESYLFAILYVLPGFVWNDEVMLNIVDTDRAFHTYINKYSGVGSSFIAEAYYNFGYGAYIVMFIYGALLATGMNKISNADRNNPIRTALLYYMLTLVLFAVRSDLYSLVRETVYAAIIMKTLYLFAHNILSNRRA